MSSFLNDGVRHSRTLCLCLLRGEMTGPGYWLYSSVSTKHQWIEDCLKETKHVRVQQPPHYRPTSNAVPCQSPLRQRVISACPFADSRCAIQGSFQRCTSKAQRIRGCTYQKGFAQRGADSGNGVWTARSGRARKHNCGHRQAAGDWLRICDRSEGVHCDERARGEAWP